MFQSDLDLFLYSKFLVPSTVMLDKNWGDLTNKLTLCTERSRVEFAGVGTYGTEPLNQIRVLPIGHFQYPPLRQQKKKKIK